MMYQQATNNIGYMPTQQTSSSTSSSNQQYQQMMPMQPHQQQLQPQMMMNMQMSAQHSQLLDVKPSQMEISTIDIDKEKEKQARENHCEIERRRRVKMAAYFSELCAMVPTCSTLQRKPDKLTILRMASSHMRNLRNAGMLNSQSQLNPNSQNDNSYKPSFLTDQELKHLILEAADGFLFVAQCDTGNIIYVSDAIEPVLSYMPHEWNSHSLFEFVHPDDLEKVKDQLSTQENSNNSSIGRILDLKTGTVKKEGHPNTMRGHIGSRRSFICRIRLGPHQPQIDLTQSFSNNNNSNNSSTINGEGASTSSSNQIWSCGSRSSRNRNTLNTNLDTAMLVNEKPLYSVLHITGYTKVWPPNQHHHHHHQQQQGNNLYHHSTNGMEIDPHQQQQQQIINSNNIHLIAIARIQMTSAPTDLVNSSNYEFVTRHDSNGIITFADQRVTNLLGYKPSDMLKKHLSEFCYTDQQLMIKEQFKTIFETKQTQPVLMNLNFMMAHNQQELVQFKTQAYAFLNPCNDQFEFIVCTHTNQKYNELNSNSNLINSRTNNSHSTPPANASSSATATSSILTNATNLIDNHHHHNHHYTNQNHLHQYQISNGTTPSYQAYSQTTPDYHTSQINSNSSGTSNQLHSSNSLNNLSSSYANYMMMPNTMNSLDPYNTNVQQRVAASTTPNASNMTWSANSTNGYM